MKKNISECKCQIHVGDVGASSSKKKSTTMSYVAQEKDE